MNNASKLPRERCLGNLRPITNKVSNGPSHTGDCLVTADMCRYLNCNDYNFTIVGGVEYSGELLKRKYVLHLKGSGKSVIQPVARFQKQWLNEAAKLLGG